MTEQPPKFGALPFAPLLATRAFVLAGGKSTRMGRDKASLSFAGQPLAARALSLCVRLACRRRSPARTHRSRVVLRRSLKTSIRARTVGRHLRRAGLHHCPPGRLSPRRSAPSAGLAGYSLGSSRAGNLQGASLCPSVNGFAQTFPVVLDRAAITGATRRARCRAQRMLFRLPGRRGQPRPAGLRGSRRVARPGRPGPHPARHSASALVPQSQLARRSSTR